jgi:hypothetical protein
MFGFGRSMLLALHFKSIGGEFPEPAEAMAGPLDPDDDRRVQL